MKIARATKDMLVRALGLNSKLVKATDKNLFDRMLYTSNALKKDEKSVSRTDLAELLKDVQSALGDKFIDPAMAEEMKKDTKVAETPAPVKEVKKTTKKESSLKKTTPKKGAPKAEKPTTEALKQTAKQLEQRDSKTEKKVEAPAKKAVKSAKKEAPAKKQEAVTPVGGDSNPKTVQMAKMFPATITVDGEEYAINHTVSKMEDLYKLFEKDAEVVLAFYWTKRHLKQFRYFNGWLGQPKSFDNDLDLVSVVYVSDAGKIAHGVSMYTEGVYSLLAEDIPEEDGIRFSSGIEYQIYVKK